MSNHRSEPASPDESDSCSGCASSCGVSHSLLDGGDVEDGRDGGSARGRVSTATGRTPAVVCPTNKAATTKRDGGMGGSPANGRIRAAQRQITPGPARVANALLISLIGGTLMRRSFRRARLRCHGRRGDGPVEGVCVGGGLTPDIPRALLAALAIMGNWIAELLPIHSRV